MCKNLLEFWVLETNHQSNTFEFRLTFYTFEYFGFFRVLLLWYTLSFWHFLDFAQTLILIGQNPEDTNNEKATQKFNKEVLFHLVDNQPDTDIFLNDILKFDFATEKILRFHQPDIFGSQKWFC